TASLAVGSHTVTASYGGDNNFSASTATLTQTVGKGNTTTAVASSVNPSVWGQSVIFTATVTGARPGAPPGVGAFPHGGTNIGQGTLTTSGGTTTASFSTSSLTVGSHTITASYGGDTTFTTSSGTLNQTVNKATSTTALASATNPSVWGQSVTFTATVS